MDKRVDISIVILNYNTFDLTKACIDSIYQKTKDVAFEIILVDNASTDRSIEKIDQIYPEIQLVLNEENLGFAKGNNIGIKKAKADTILLLNSDIVLLNDAVSICYKELWKKEEIGVITSSLISEDGSLQHQCRAFETIRNTLIEKFRIHKLWSPEKRAHLLLNGYFDHTYPIETERIWGTFFMFKQTVLNHLPENKLADRFFMYGEDTEWCYQVAKYTDLKILYFPDAKVLHYGGGSNFNATASDSKANAIKNNKRAYLSDYYGKTKTELLLWLKGE